VGWDGRKCRPECGVCWAYALPSSVGGGGRWGGGRGGEGFEEEAAGSGGALERPSGRGSRGRRADGARDGANPDARGGASAAAAAATSSRAKRRPPVMFYRQGADAAPVPDQRSRWFGDCGNSAEGHRGTEAPAV
jgi:hypothetical protein